jgi:hypothetical protein
MARPNQALKVAMAAVGQLPPRLQRQLAEEIIAAGRRDDQTTVIYLQRLPRSKRARLAALMDKRDKVRLSTAETIELKRLGSEVEQMLLANSHALAQALRPELFDQRGRPITRRFRQALSVMSRRRAAPHRRMPACESRIPRQLATPNQGHGQR